MLSFDIEEENLDKLIRQKEKEFIIEEEKEEEKDEDKIYPLFRNYPNGTNDYYLKLKSIEFSKWKNKLRILFLDKTILGDKYFELLKRLGCKVVKEKQNCNYNLIISNDKQKVSELMTDVPTIYINCNPLNCGKKDSLFYFDNKKQYQKYSFYCNVNNIEYIYRENKNDFLDAISKIKEAVL